MKVPSQVCDRTGSPGFLKVAEFRRKFKKKRARRVSDVSSTENEARGTRTPTEEFMTVVQRLRASYSFGESSSSYSSLLQPSASRILQDRSSMNITPLAIGESPSGSSREIQVIDLDVPEDMRLEKRRKQNKKIFVPISEVSSFRSSSSLTSEDIETIYLEDEKSFPRHRDLPPSPGILYLFESIVSERLGAHVLELPYKGNDISMFIILPPFAKTNGVESVIKQLSVESLHELLEDDLPRNVEVAIPKFTIEQTITLTPILECLGVGDLFQSTSDLSGFTGEQGLRLDEAIHKAKISVDEQGTVAAASTAIFSFRSSRPLTPARFIANHPFVYLIFDKTSQTIQFMGVYRYPN